MLPNTSNLLQPLTSAGLTVRVVDGNRLAVVPADRLTHELRQHIRLHKSELLVLLAANDPHPPAPVHRSGVIRYQLMTGDKGTLIDPDGIESAIWSLGHTYGDRLDWLALVETLQGMGEAAQAEAEKLLERIRQ